jgi:hypothetical protein
LIRIRAGVRSALSKNSESQLEFEVVRENCFTAEDTEVAAEDAAESPISHAVLDEYDPMNQ